MKQDERTTVKPWRQKISREIAEFAYAFSCLFLSMKLDGYAEKLLKKTFFLDCYCHFKIGFSSHVPSAPANLPRPTNGESPTAEDCQTTSNGEATTGGGGGVEGHPQRLYSGSRSFSGPTDPSHHVLTLTKSELDRACKDGKSHKLFPANFKVN